jgi:stearoyl-CoA desaturase (delta-9 desaturase)
VSTDIDWLRSIPYFAVHAGTFLVFVTGVTSGDLAVCAASYVVRMFAITAGYHRYFSHRSYRTGRALQFLLALVGTMATQKGPLWWAAHHRHHHRTADTPDDLHSPHHGGFWHAHVGWFLTPASRATRLELVPDLREFPELRFLDRHYRLPPLLLALGLYAIGGLPWLAWGFFVSTVLVWHATNAINTVAHLRGSQPHRVSDTSRNNRAMAVLTLGEGWHNNHHAQPGTYRHGLLPGQWDPTGVALRALARLGLVWDLREPGEAPSS